jgi:hypothetical protein
MKHIHDPFEDGARGSVNARQSPGACDTGALRDDAVDEALHSRSKIQNRKAPCATCNDCAVNVIAAGEYYMANSEIWKDQLQLGWNDNLCIGCIETRLGRRLTILDFCTFPKNPGGFATSERYLRRLLGDKEFQKLQRKAGTR